MTRAPALTPDRVAVVQGDTDRIASGVGTGGSSSITCGGASLDAAAKKLADNLMAQAGEALEASTHDLEIAGGAVRVAGTDRAISFAALAQRPDAEEYLTAADTFSPPQETYPNGTHVAEVEIDPATGETQIVSARMRKSILPPLTRSRRRRRPIPMAPTWRK